VIADNAACDVVRVVWKLRWQQVTNSAGVLRLSFLRSLEEATNVTRMPKTVTKMLTMAMIASFDQPEAESGFDWLGCNGTACVARTKVRSTKRGTYECILRNHVYSRLAVAGVCTDE
jgi:hypothetical protein